MELGTAKQYGLLLRGNYICHCNTYTVHKVNYANLFYLCYYSNNTVNTKVKCNMNLCKPASFEVNEDYVNIHVTTHT